MNTFLHYKNWTWNFSRKWKWWSNSKLHSCLGLLQFTENV